MGLLQKAIETYDAHVGFVGKYIEGKTVLAPIGHIVTRADIEITLNQDGEFCGARRIDKHAQKIIIPATESSAGRTSGICAHPLCDQLKYLAPNDVERHDAFMRQFSAWCNSSFAHPKLKPILNYLRHESILKDLFATQIISEEENKDIEKLLVCWRVIGLNDGMPSACWQDQSLFEAFNQFYAEQQKQASVAICMVSGKESSVAQQHPKGVIPFYGNAKLISSNDTSGFTYLGRFTANDQAAQISYEASQKAHNALRWLASEQGAQAVYGGRTFLCWNPKGKKVPQCTSVFMSSPPVTQKQSDYLMQLKETLQGYQSRLPESADVVIAVFDAATSGRLALTCYRELRGSDFLSRLYDWDALCCWPNGVFGIQSPGLYQIVNCAFGNRQEDKGKTILKTDDKVLSQQMQRLVACRIDRSPMPSDIVKAVTNRASTLFVYDMNLRRNILFVACAVIRKYRFEKYKEEWKMYLEPEKRDRSYQFGRLLAIFEKAERDTYGSDEDREPNAIRQQAIFCQRPMYAAGNIEKQLEQAYFPRLKPRGRMFYKKLIGQIMEQISAFPKEEWNLPLSETYLMGYYLQRNDLYTAKNNENTEEAENG